MITSFTAHLYADTEIIIKDHKKCLVKTVPVDRFTTLRFRDSRADVVLYPTRANLKELRNKINAFLEATK